MKKTSVKLFVAIICILTFCITNAINISAEEIQHITILGDSISKGYGLKEDEKNYGMWLGEYFNAEVSNYAASGKTTQELIDQLNDNDEVIESVKNADLICVSIGGNDLLDFIFDDLFNAAKNYTSSASGYTGLSPEAVENLIVSISTAIGPASIKAGENTGSIADRLTELNPQAKPIFQTVYNPFESNNQDFKDILPPLRTFASIYLVSINKPIMKNEKIICADIKSKFKGLCPYLTNMNELDIHPNKTGHIMIAEEIIQQLKIPGNFSIFDGAFDDMTEGTPDDIPQELRDEISFLSNGEFRSSEIPTETTVAKTTSKETATTSETEIKEVSAGKNIKRGNHENTSSSVTYIIIASISILIAVMIIVTVKAKKGSERK